MKKNTAACRRRISGRIRFSFTAVELLAVIAVILLLSGIGLFAITKARAKSRQTACVSNQGQTMKLLLSAMQKNNEKLISGTTDDTRYTKWLMDKNMIQTLDAVRCPELTYSITADKISDADARKEAYGVVTSSAADGSFNFKSNKLRKSGTVDITPAMMFMGACAAKNLEKAEASAELDFSSVKPIAVHSNAVNVFFLDGSVSALTAADYKSKSFYRPKADGSGAEKVDCSKILCQ